MKKYRFLFFTLLLGFFFIPKGADAQVTNIRYYNTNFNLLANTTNNYYGEYIPDVRYIRVMFDDTLEPNTSYITSFDFESTSPTDYLWIYWNGNSGVNIGGSYRTTSPTSARTISQGVGDNGDFFKRSFLTFDFQNTIGSSSNFFQIDLGSPQIVSYFRMNNYTISATSDANTDAIINGFNNLESSMAQNNQALIDNQNKNQQQTNEKLDNIESSITSTEGPSLDAIEDSSGWLPPGPVDSILNLPLTFLNNLISNLSKTCSPVSIPIPFVNQSFQLPCISSLYDSMGITTFVNWVGLISGTLILYYYLLNLYKWVDNTIQMKDNNDWGGV